MKKIIHLTVLFWCLFTLFTPLFAQNTDLSVTVKSNSTTFTNYRYITFFVTVKNNGTAAATNVRVGFPKPSNGAYSCSRTTKGEWIAWEAPGYWNIGSLAIGDTAHLQATYFTLEGNSIVGSASVTSTTAGFSDPVSSNNASSVTVIKGADAPYLGCDGPVTTNSDSIDLEITNTINNTEVNVGLAASMVIKIYNKSSKNATGVKGKVTLPTGLTYLNHDAPQGTYNSTTNIWDLGDVPGYGNRTIVLNCTATQGGSLRVVTQVSAANEPDLDSQPNNYNASNTTPQDDEAVLDLTGMQADLSLRMALKNGTTQVKTGDTINYLVILKNNGPTRCDGTKVRCIPPANALQYVSSSGTVGVYDNSVGVWLLSTQTDANGNKMGFTIAANREDTMTLRFKAIQTGTVAYNCEVRSVNTPDPNSTPSNNNPAENDDATLTVTVSNNPNVQYADLELGQNAQKIPVNVGDSLVYTIAINNKGTSAATGVKVAYVVPDSFGIDQTTMTAGTTFSAGIWNVGNLTVNGFAQIQFKGKSKCLKTPTKSFAQVSASDQADTDSSPNNNNSQTVNEDDEALLTIAASTSGCPSTPPPSVADLELAMNADKTSVLVGDTLTYTLMLQNKGTQDATTVTVEDILPSGLTIISSTPSSGTFATNTWNVGTLLKNTSATLSLKTKVTAIATSITNFAQVKTSGITDPDSSPNNNATSTPNEDDEAAFTVTKKIINTGGSPDLELVLSAPSQYKTALPIYQNVVFSCKVFNKGQGDATSVKVKYPIVQGMAYNSNTTTKGQYEAYTGIWDVGTLAVGDSATLSLTLFTLQTTTQQFAQVSNQSPNDLDSTPNNDTNNTPNEDDESLLAIPSVNLVKSPDLELQLSANKTLVTKGTSVALTFRIENKGDTTAVGVALKHNAPASLSFISSIVAQGSYNSSTGVWTIGNIPPATFLTLILNDTVNDATANIVAFGQVSAATPSDVDSAPNNNATTTPNEDDEAALTLFKQGSGNTCDLELTMQTTATYKLYDYKDFSLTLRNTGGVAATNVVVDFPFPMHFVNGGKFVSSAGTNYDTYTQYWTVGTLAAGQTVTMTATLFNNNAAGSIKAFAQVRTASPIDTDSSPNNNTTTTPNEDDEAGATITPANNNNLVVKEKPQFFDMTIESIYPNPNNGEFNLNIMNYAEVKNVRIDFYDMQGRLAFSSWQVAEKGENTWFIDALAVGKGLYQVHLVGTDKRKAYRIMKE